MSQTDLRRPIEELEALYPADRLLAQLSTEERMVTLGRDRIRKQIARAQEKGMETTTSYGQSILAHSIDKVSAAITAVIEKADTGKAGRRMTQVKYLKMVEPDVAALIALRLVIDNLTGKNHPLAFLCTVVGDRIEDEVRFNEFAENKAKMFKRASDRASKQTSYERSKTVMAGYERRFLDAEWDSWPKQHKLQLGALLIDLIKEAGIVQFGSRVVTRKKTVKVLEATAELVEWIEKEKARSEMLHPAYLPMLVPPLDWTTPFDGGYLTADAQRGSPLVKAYNRAYLQELADNADQMPSVYEAINGLQRTPWQINPRLFDTVSQLWEDGDEGSGLPSREDTDYCPCPKCGASIGLAKLNTRHKEEHECFADPAVLKQWKREAYVTHSTNVSLRSKRLKVATTLRTARTYRNEPELYFPYTMDFRGRLYCICPFNPQGDDMSKAMLRFAEGKPIEDGVAAGWLAIQGANVYGEDKVSLSDRIAWVEDHEEEIKQVSEDPFGNRWWLTADKPFQFLAFCFEWAGFLEQGYGFVSHLPIALDGSCSGIQHFSAMLRDEVGGAAVNLVPSEKPNDIYQMVCDRVIDKLKLDAEGGDNHEYQEWARGWLSLEPNRKTTKRQVMTLPYGSTQKSCRDYTQEWLLERIEEGAEEPWPIQERFMSTQYMSALIWQAIGEVVVAARAAMDWLKKCARAAASSELPVYWTTPIGFMVMQRYRSLSSRQVRSTLSGSVIKLSLAEEQNKLDKRKMQNGISPNFVHSLDATHLMLSVCYALDNGIKSFAMIHDSFGTHAADAELLGGCLREAFVDLYKDMDVLEDFRSQVLRQIPGEELPEVPEKGSLDLEVIRNSDFFFA